MDTCRICDESICDAKLSKGALRPKQQLRVLVLRTTGIDFNEDPPGASKFAHAKCMMRMTRGSFSGTVKDYKVQKEARYGDRGMEVGDDKGGDGQDSDDDGEEAADGDRGMGVGDNGGGDRQDSEDVEEDSKTEEEFLNCILCKADFKPEKGKRRRYRTNVTAATKRKLMQIYQISELNLPESTTICGVCRNLLDRGNITKLPNLSISLPPLATSSTDRPACYRKRKDLMNMNRLTGKYKNVKQARPGLAQLLDTIEDFANKHDYDMVELAFFVLHNFLSASSRFADARRLKLLHRHGSKIKISPRKSVANKCSSGRSHRKHRELALFLKQQLGRDIFPSRKAEDEFVDSIQPPSYSYKLFSMQDDPECTSPFKDVKGLQRPVPPNTAGMTPEDAEALTADHRAQIKLYKEALAPDDFLQKYMNKHSESPVPDTLVAIHGYDRLLAAHLHQLAPAILAKIGQINSSGCGKKIPTGRLIAKVCVVDGSDGFSDLNVISNSQDRQISNHGITYDFSVISVSVKHEIVDEEERQSSKGEDEEAINELSQQFFSQSSIGESSCFDQSQDTQGSSDGSQGAAVETGEGSSDGSQEETGEEGSQVEDKFTIVYQELKTNSPLVSRPVFR